MAATAGAPIPKYLVPSIAQHSAQKAASQALPRDFGYMNKTAKVWLRDVRTVSGTTLFSDTGRWPTLTGLTNLTSTR